MRVSSSLFAAFMVLAFVLPSFSQPPTAPTSRRVMTFNIDCPACDVHYTWPHRQAGFKDIFDRYQPDLFGCQELTTQSNVEDFLSILPNNMTAIYWQGDKVDPDATIFYRPDKFELLANGFFWLSPTPDQPFTRGFSPLHQVTPRMWNWAHFVDLETNTEFLFTTTHFDNNSPCQTLSAPLVLERTAPWNFAMPVISTGDFNSNWDSTAYATLTNGRNGSYPSYSFEYLETYSLSPIHAQVTNQNPPLNYNEEKAIDHVFVGEGRKWGVTYWAVDTTTYEGGKYVSDHFAIVADVDFSGL